MNWSGKKLMNTVMKTDSGMLVENMKVYWIIKDKELGKNRSKIRED